MKHGKRLLSFLLTLALLLGCLPLNAAADDAAGGETTDIASLLQDDVVALRPYIDGLETVGTQLTGQYTFHDFSQCEPVYDTSNFQGQVEPYAQNVPTCSLTGACTQGDQSTYQWYRSDTATGTPEAISGATAKTYTITEEDLGKYLFFGVTPRSASLTGTEERSNPIGPVITQEQYDKRDQSLNNNNSYSSNVAALQNTVFTKMQGAAFFTVDTEVTTRITMDLHGAPYAYVGTTRKALDNATRPYRDENGAVYVTKAFVTDILGLDASAMTGDMELSAAAALLGKEVWSVPAESKTGNFRLDSFTDGLYALCDPGKTPTFDPISDRNALNEAVNMLFDMKASDEQLAWFEEAKFGMFIHWDPSSIEGVEISWDRRAQRPGEGGWGYNNEVEPYYDTQADQFNPTAFDAQAIVQMAVDAGMKYIVFTTKHHGGFSNFDSAYDNYDIMSTPYGQDIFSQLADAAHAAGLKVGAYYSQRDWYNPYYLRQNENEDHSRYLEYMYGQLDEICSQYGQVDILWFDSCGQSSLNAWESKTIIRRLKQLNPDILINNRLTTLSDASMAEVTGDYNTPEQRIGAYDPNNLWESCVTMQMPPKDTGGWSYRPESEVRSANDSIKMLSSTITGGGNLLYNIGPMYTGAIDPEVQATLAGVGDWMDVNYAAVYGVTGGPIAPQSWGGTSYKDNGDGTQTMYVHVYNQPGGNAISVPAQAGKVYRDVKLLANGEAVSCFKSGDNYIFALTGQQTWSDSVTVIQVTVQDGQESGDTSVDRTALMTLLDEARAVMDESILYEPGSYQMFTAAFTQAETVCYGADSTQTQVDEAHGALQDALDHLEKLENLALNKTAYSDNNHPASPSLNASSAVDGDWNTRWATRDGTSAATLELDFGTDTSFNTILVGEYLDSGEQTRVNYFQIDVWSEDTQTWNMIFQDTSIGTRRIFELPKTFTAQKIRLNVTSCKSPVTIWEFQVYAVPDTVADQIYLNKTSASLTVDEQLQLTATQLPAPETAPTFQWKSSNDAAAMVDQNGLVTAVGAGTAEITVTAGDLSAVCQVTVTEKPEDGVLFADDFSDPEASANQWTGAPAVSGGIANIGFGKLVGIGNQTFGAVTYEFEMAVQSGANWTGFLFNRTSADDTWDDSGYMVYLRSDAEAGKTAGTVELNKKDGGTIASGMVPDYQAGELVPFRVEYQEDGTITVWAKDQQILTVQDSTYTSGYAAFYCSGNGGCGVIDNVQIAANTVLNTVFFDDFSDAEASKGNWTSEPSIQGGVNYIGVNGLTTIRDLTPDEAVYEFEMAVQNGANWMGFLFNRTNSNDTWDNSGYMLYMRSDREGHPAGTVELMSAKGSTLATAQVPDYQAGELVPFQVISKDGTLTVYAKGQQLFAVQDSAYTGGYAGFYCSGHAGNGAIDNVRVLANLQPDDAQTIQATFDAMEQAIEASTIYLDSTKISGLPAGTRGYTVAITSSDSDVVNLDGTVTPPSEETAVTVTFRLSYTFGEEEQAFREMTKTYTVKKCTTPEDTAHFLDMKYGLFVHYVWSGKELVDNPAVGQPYTISARYPDGTKAETIDEMIENFDAEQFAQDCADWGIQYVMFTAWHYRMNPVYHSDVYEAWRDYDEGDLPTDDEEHDLILKVYNALSEKGIDLYLYTHPYDLHDFSAADQEKFGYDYRGDLDFEYDLWNDYINAQYKELCERYQGMFKGMFIDEGLANPANNLAVDYDRLRDTIKSVDPSLVMIQNEYNGKYTCDTSMWELPTNGKTHNLGEWPVHTISIGTTIGNLSNGYSFWAQYSRGDGDRGVEYAQDLFRYTVMEAGSNTEGGGQCWAAGPYCGNVNGIWEDGIDEAMTQQWAYLEPIQESVLNTRPSASYPTAARTTFNGLTWGVATESPDGTKTYIHVLKPGQDNTLTIGAPQDGKQFVWAELLTTNAIVTMTQTDAGVTLTLPEDASWDALDTVIVLHTTEAPAETEYTITVTQTTGGVIEPGTVTVEEGGSQTFAIRPDAGYEIADVLMDGESVGAVNTYTFSDVTADHTITASFRQTGGTTPSVSRYTITVTQATGGKISPSTVSVTEGSDKTFTITADEGYKIADVLVDGKRVGAVSTYTFENVTAQHTITAKFEKVEEISNMGDFTDVKSTDWFAAAVQYAVDEGLMNGTSETTFSPNGATTRAMIVTILYRQAGSPAVESDGKTWWSDAQAWAMANGISDGTNMDKEITREQLATMLYRYAALTGRDVSQSTELDDFQDASQVSGYAMEALEWAAAEGIITGKTGGVIDPQAGATRAETATMFMRFAQ